MLAADCRELAQQVSEAVNNYGKNGSNYVYEVDGFGNQLSWMMQMCRACYRCLTSVGVLQ